MESNFNCGGSGSANNEAPIPDSSSSEFPLFGGASDLANQAVGNPPTTIFNPTEEVAQNVVGDSALNSYQYTNTLVNVQNNNSDICTTNSDFSENGLSNDSGVSSDESRPLTGDAMHLNNFQDFRQPPVYPFSMPPDFTWFGNQHQLWNKCWQWPSVSPLNSMSPIMPIQQNMQRFAKTPPVPKINHSNVDDLVGIAENLVEDDLKSRIHVELKDQNLWEKFAHHEMEMIITKSGRNLFPKLAFHITGLEPSNLYLFHILFRRLGDQKFKFVKGGWIEAGKAEEEIGSNEFPHSENARFPKGSTWMQSELGFPKLKLTNNTDETSRNNHAVILRSMHKYVPVLVIHRFDPAEKKFVRFVEREITLASFIAVTAYQNADVTNLKISANPFAKGFREGGRKRASNDDEIHPYKMPMMNPMFGDPYNNSYAGLNNYFNNLGMNFPNMGLPSFQAMNPYMNALQQYPFMFPPSS